MPTKSSTSESPISAKSPVKTKRKALPPSNKTRKDTASAVSPSVQPEITSEQREQMIRETAYYLSEKDGFQIGKEDEYWIQAEEQVEKLLKA